MWDISVAQLTENEKCFHFLHIAESFWWLMKLLEIKKRRMSFYLIVLVPKCVNIIKREDRLYHNSRVENESSNSYMLNTILVWHLELGRNVFQTGRVAVCWQIYFKNLLTWQNVPLLQKGQNLKWTLVLQAWGCHERLINVHICGSTMNWRPGQGLALTFTQRELGQVPADPSGSE